MDMGIKTNKSMAGLQETPVQVPYGSALEMRDVAVAFMLADGDLCDRFGGREATKAFLVEVWNFRKHFDGVAAALESPNLKAYLYDLNASLDSQGVRKAGGVDGEDLKFFLDRLDKRCKEISPGHFDVPQKVRAFGEEFVLPGFESLEVTLAARMNGRSLFYAFERGGMYGHGVYGPDGGLVAGFGPYGSPKIASVDGVHLLMTDPDPFTGLIGLRKKGVVFRDEFGRELFRAKEFVIEHDKSAGYDVMFYTDPDGNERRLLRKDVMQMLDMAAGKVSAEQEHSRKKGITGSGPARRKGRGDMGL